MGNDQKTIYVYSDWSGGSPKLMGMLYAYGSRGKELFSFEYRKEWIQFFGSSNIFDPDLSLFGGRQYAPSGKLLFGIFADSCPDRWGRLLMNRKEAIQAKKEGRRPQSFAEYK